MILDAIPHETLRKERLMINRFRARVKLIVHGPPPAPVVVKKQNPVARAGKAVSRFVTGFINAFTRKCVDVVVGTYRNFEAIVLLTLAALGATSILSMMPFYFTMPLWIEGPMVIPVLAVMVVSMFLALMDYRIRRREAVTVA